MNPLLEEMRQEIDKRYTPAPKEDKPPFQPYIIDAAQLETMDFGQIRWAIEGLLPEGACILAGSPKMGKSWFALNIGLAIALGGVALSKHPVEQGKVYYLALEDSFRRLQERIRKMLQPTGQSFPADLKIATRWTKYKEGGLAAIAEIIREQKPRLVIIDTLERVRNTRNNNSGIYGEDYDTIAVLQDLALENGVAILIITHVRKQGAHKDETVDPLEEVSGSMGLTGAADVVLVLKRSRHKKEATLFVTGRDIEEAKIPLRFDPEYGIWHIEDKPETASLSSDQKRIIEVLQHSPTPLGILAIIERAKPTKDYEAAARMIRRLAADGLIRKDGHGRYKSESSEPSDLDSDHSDHSDTEDNPFA